MSTEADAETALLTNFNTTAFDIDLLPWMQVWRRVGLVIIACGCRSDYDAPQDLILPVCGGCSIQAVGALILQAAVKRKLPGLSFASLPSLTLLTACEEFMRCTSAMRTASGVI